jgi:exodeoxyribonuclease VII small subunit
MTKQKSEPQKKDEGQNFEKSLAKLETIVNEMESGKLGLDEMIRRFEEGQALVKFCTDKLNEVERKIEILVKKGEELVAEPFESDETNESDEGDGGGEKGQSDKLL